MPNINQIKRKVKRNRLLVLAITFTIFISVVIFSKLHSGNLETPQDNQSPNQSQNVITSPIQNIQILLETEIAKLPGSYYVYLKDLKTNQVYAISENEKIPSASIYKLAVMYKTFDSLEKDDLSKKQIMYGDITVEKALELMIAVSDNNAALTLAEKLGWRNINSFLENEGIEGFNLMVKDYPTTTAQATAILLEKIYHKTAISQTASQEMLNLLLAQQKNDRIPLNLPININVAHKTGELDNFRHDAGIVFGKKSDYIFVFLTETPDPEATIINIAKLSKTMFEALEHN